MKTNSALTKIVGIGIRQEDIERLKIQKGFLVAFTIFMSIGGLVWGLITYSHDLLIQSLIPFGYVIASTINLIYFSISKEIKVVRLIQVFFSLLLPFLFQWLLGGFFPSGMVMLWSVLALIASFTFQSIFISSIWLVFFLILSITSGIFNDYFQSFKPEILPDASLLFSGFNFFLSSSMLFGLVII